MDSSLNSLPLPVLLPFVVAGICVFSGLNHLLIFYRNPKDRIHGIFWAMCLLIASVSICSSHLYRSSTVEEATFYLKTLIGCGQIFFLFFLWFVGLYTQFLPVKTLTVISVFHAVVAVLNFFSPGSILFTEITQVSPFTFPTGNQIWMIDDYTMSPAIYLFFASYLINFSFDAVACYKFYRQGAVASAHLLAISLFLFIGTVTHDMLMTYSLPITPVTWSEYGFLAVIILMSLKLSNDYYLRSTIEVEDKYRRLVEGLDEDYFVYSRTPDGKYEYLSPSAEGIFSTPIEKMIGMDWRQFIDRPDSLKKGNEADRVCNEGSRPDPFEIELNQEGNGSHILEIQEGPIFDQDGEVILIEGIGKDVTETKKNEKELTAARDSLRQMNLKLEERIQERTKELSEANDRLLEEKVFSETLLESLPGIFYLIRPDGTFFRWNQNFERVTGYSTVEMSEIVNLVLFHEEDLPEVREVMGQIFGGKPGSLEMPMVMKDGSTRPYYFTGDLVHLRDEDLIIGMGIDVTEKKKAEEDFRRAHQLLDLHIENSPLGVIGWNQDYLVEQWSPKAEEIFGWNHDEILGKDWRDFEMVHPEDSGRVREVSDNLLKGKVHSMTFTNRNLKKTGEEIWCEWHSSVIHNEKVGVVSLFSFVQDVTEKRRIEDELENHRNHLEILVGERTAALEKAQEELVQQEKLATLGQVMATISHELRNPLGTIRGSIYTVEQKVGREDPDLNRPLDRINRNIRRCDQIVDELLDFVRETPLDFSQVQIDSYIHGVLQDYVTPDGVEVETDFGATNLWVRIDEERFRRCLVNLLSNACDAILQVTEPDPDRSFRLSLSTTVSKTNTIEIRVRDSGVGIPSDLQEKIFEPMFSTKSFGIGLGLHIVRNIMTRHGGGIEIEETSPKGTTVRLWIPRDV